MHDNPNLKIEIHDFASSSHSWTLHKIIAEPTGATHIFCKPHKYEHKANSKNSISRFGDKSKIIRIILIFPHQLNNIYFMIIIGFFYDK